MLIPLCLCVDRKAKEAELTATILEMTEIPQAEEIALALEVAADVMKAVHAFT